MRSARIKKETEAAILSRIKLSEGQEKRLVLMIQFPPSGCRSAGVWREAKTAELEVLRQRLAEDRQKLDELKSVRLTVQLELDLPLLNRKRVW